MAKRSRYTNKQSGKTEEEREIFGLTTRTELSGVGRNERRVRKASQALVDEKFTRYRSQALRDNNGSIFTQNHIGTIRNGKNEEQVKAQLERINKLYGGISDNVTNARRFLRARSSAQAYLDFHSLGIKPGAKATANSTK